MRILLSALLIATCACTTISKREQIIFYDGENKPQSEIELKNGARSGNFTLWYPSGSIMTKCKEHTSPLFSCTHYYDGEKPLRVYHHNDQILHDSYNEYYDNGQLYISGQFVNSKRHGFWQFFSPFGESIRVVQYNYDTVIAAEPSTPVPCPELTEDELTARANFRFIFESNWCQTVIKDQDD